MTRILLASLFHETHCFVDDITRLDAFRIRRGDEIMARAGDGSVIDGFLHVAAAQNWIVLPTIDYSATPSGIVDHAAFEAFWTELEHGLRAALAEGLDGILLGLHGAMITTAEPDVEGEVLRRIRAVPGAETLPIFGAFDLHANLTQAMCTEADSLLCYRECPHIDARETAMRAAQLLVDCLANKRRPHMRFRSVPIMLAPTGTDTADQPMRALEEAARLAEAEPGILAVNVVAGFSFADCRDAGVAFCTVGHDDAAADAVLDRLAAIAWDRRHEGSPVEHDVDEVLSRIMPVTNGPIVLVEPADNIGGGAPGDCTDVLRALLRHNVQNAAIALNDAAAVAAFSDAQPGETRRIELGGHGSRLDLGPVTLDVTLVSRSEGRFTLEDKQSHLAASVGTAIEMGPCAVVRHGGITILLTSSKTPPFDLAQWRSQGIDPESLAIVVVKAAVAHRRAYNPIAAASYTLRTRGPCTSNIHALPYTKLRRPIFPLDADASPGAP